MITLLKNDIKETTQSFAPTGKQRGYLFGIRVPLRLVHLVNGWLS